MSKQKQSTPEAAATEAQERSQSDVPALADELRWSITLPPGTSTNIDLSTNSGKVLAINASSPGTLDFDDARKDALGRRYVDILAVHFLCFPDSRIDTETGEIHEYTRTVLIDKSGETFRTSASHAPLKMRTLMSVWSPGDWAKGIPIRITERMGKRRTLYHDFTVNL